MEFLRFGSSIPGSYWGCCAVDIIQNFSNHSPSEKAYIELVEGDGGTPVLKNGERVFAGPTFKDIFLTRLRIGTFEYSDMPNHAFFAILTKGQLNSSRGKEWLELLKSTGFEFIRAVDNSVYSGSELADCPGEAEVSPSVNNIFALIRNIGQGTLKNPFQPPKEWLALSGGKLEGYPDPEDHGLLVKEQGEFDNQVWKTLVDIPLILESEIPEKDKKYVWCAGRRSEYPQEVQTAREYRSNSEKSCEAAPW